MSLWSNLDSNYSVLVGKPSPPLMAKTSIDYSKVASSRHYWPSGRGSSVLPSHLRPFKNFMIVPGHKNNMRNSTMLPQLVHGEKKNEKSVQLQQTRFAKPPQNKEQPASSQDTKQKDSESRPEWSHSSSGGYNLRVYCHRCGHKGHLARNCQSTRPKQESPGCSDEPKETSIKMVGVES